MAALQKLTDDLIARVFRSATDPHSAVSLSSTNRRLRRIWLQGTEPFAAETLKHNIIAYEQAVDLALAEERLEGHSAAFTAADPPIQRLLRNHELAESAATAFQIWLDNQHATSYRKKITFGCYHTAYYLVRKLALAYRHPQAQLQISLLEALRTSSSEALHTNAELMVFLGGQASEDERIKHGMPMPEEDWPVEEENAESVDLPEWDYAGEVAHCALVDYLYDLGKLEPAMNSVL